MSLAERLRKAREEAGLTLKKFSEISKIQLKYLERLEGGQFDKLPAFVYTQGFLKKYSQILNLPAEEILNDYRKETEAASAIRKKELVQLPVLPSPKIIITPKKIRWAIIGLVLLFVVGYLFYQLDFLVEAPKLSLEYPAQDLTINRTTIQISGQTDTSAKLTVNGQQIFVEPDGKFRQDINLSPGLNTLNIEAVNRFGKENRIIRNIIVQ